MPLKSKIAKIVKMSGLMETPHKVMSFMLTIMSGFKKSTIGIVWG